MGTDWENTGGLATLFWLLCAGLFVFGCVAYPAIRAWQRLHPADLEAQRTQPTDDTSELDTIHHR